MHRLDEFGGPDPLAVPIRQRGCGALPLCSTARTVSSSNTTPGRIGAPGKCPSRAGCPASILNVVTTPTD
jgi:hypothetical protein